MFYVPSPGTSEASRPSPFMAIQKHTLQSTIALIIVLKTETEE